MTSASLLLRQQHAINDSSDTQRSEACILNFFGSFQRRDIYVRTEDFHSPEIGNRLQALPDRLEDIFGIKN
jgi:hypothetical protein